jgi:cysteine desulfurase
VSISPRRIYLDHNASAPLSPQAQLAMRAAMEVGGNPSSIHREGRRARHVVEDSRSRIAGWVGCERDEVVFTSGGTEANSLGVIAGARLARARGARPRVVTWGTEHPSTRGAVDALRGEGFEVVLLPVGGEGQVELGALREVASDGLALIAVSAVNHEVGTRHALAPIVEAARRAHAHLHLDAVAAAGKLVLAELWTAAATMSLSAHKVGGPLGAGALIVRSGVELAPVAGAGHQERGRRPGSESVVAIAGFAAAAEASDPAQWARVVQLSDELEAGLRALGARIHGAGATRVGGTVNVAWPGALGESVVMALDLAGVAASTGAACSSGSILPSPVLRAMGLSEAAAREAVRLSLGRLTSEAEVHEVLRLFPQIVARARAA